MGVDRSAAYWIPLFTQYWPDDKILDPAFAITFDHCKLCDTHVERSEQKEHLRKHKRELKSWRSRKLREADAAARRNLAKGRKVRAR